MNEPHGYSGTPLPRKLGLKAEQRVRLLDAPGHYWTLIGRSPAALGLEVLPPGSRADADFTHLFATRLADLRRLLGLARAGMAENGMVWVSWPKKSGSLPAEIGREEVMSTGKAAGLVDVKVCAVDGDWSGLKFVIPLSERDGG